MSRIKKMIEEMNEHIPGPEAEYSEKRSVSFRLDLLNMWRLDFLCKRFEATKAAFVQGLVEEATVEALEVLGYDIDTQVEMFLTEHLGKTKEEARELMVATGNLSGEKSNV